MGWGPGTGIEEMRWGISSDISKGSLVEWTWKLFIFGLGVLFNGIGTPDGNDGVGYFSIGCVCSFLGQIVFYSFIFW